MQLRPTILWTPLIDGCFDLAVLKGGVSIQASDRQPAADALGTVVMASVGAAPTRLGDDEEWWIKAVIADTVVSLVAVAPSDPIATPTPAPTAGICSINGHTGSAIILTAHDVGTLTTAEIKALVENTQGAAAAVASGAVAAGDVLYAADDGSVAPASSSNAAQFGRVVGLAYAAAALGDSVVPILRGFVDRADWAFSPGPVYVGDDGALVQKEPTSGFIQVAGVALLPTRVLICMEAPILLGAGSLDEALAEATLPAASIIATMSMSAGAQVNIFGIGDDERARLADAAAGLPSHGFILDDVAADDAVPVHRLGGRNAALSGLSAGMDYFLDAAGGVTATQNVSAGQVDQYIGTAVNPTTLIQPMPQIAVFN